MSFGHAIISTSTSADRQNGGNENRDENDTRGLFIEVEQVLNDKLACVRGLIGCLYVSTTIKILRDLAKANFNEDDKNKIIEILRKEEIISPNPLVTPDKTSQEPQFVYTENQISRLSHILNYLVLKPYAEQLDFRTTDSRENHILEEFIALDLKIYDSQWSIFIKKRNLRKFKQYDLSEEKRKLLYDLHAMQFGDGTVAIPQMSNRILNLVRPLFKKYVNIWDYLNELHSLEFSVNDKNEVIEKIKNRIQGKNDYDLASVSHMLNYLLLDDCKKYFFSSSDKLNIYFDFDMFLALDLEIFACGDDNEKKIKILKKFTYYNRTAEERKILYNLHLKQVPTSFITEAKINREPPAIPKPLNCTAITNGALVLKPFSMSKEAIFEDDSDSEDEGYDSDDNFSLQVNPNVRMYHDSHDCFYLVGDANDRGSPAEVKLPLVELKYLTDEDDVRVGVSVNISDRSSPVSFRHVYSSGISSTIGEVPGSCLIFRFNKYKLEHVKNKQILPGDFIVYLDANTRIELNNILRSDDERFKNVKDPIIDALSQTTSIISASCSALTEYLLRIFELCRSRIDSQSKKSDVFSIAVMRVPRMAVEIIRTLVERPEKSARLIQRFNQLNVYTQLTAIKSELAREEYFPRPADYHDNTYSNAFIQVYTKEQLNALDILELTPNHIRVKKEPVRNSSVYGVQSPGISLMTPSPSPSIDDLVAADVASEKFELVSLLISSQDILDILKKLSALKFSKNDRDICIHQASINLPAEEINRLYYILNYLFDYQPYLTFDGKYSDQTLDAFIALDLEIFQNKNSPEQQKAILKIFTHFDLDPQVRKALYNLHRKHIKHIENVQGEPPAMSQPSAYTIVDHFTVMPQPSSQFNHATFAEQKTAKNDQYLNTRMFADSDNAVCMVSACGAVGIPAEAKLPLSIELKFLTDKDGVRNGISIVNLAKDFRASLQYQDQDPCKLKAENCYCIPLRRLEDALGTMIETRDLSVLDGDFILHVNSNISYTKILSAIRDRLTLLNGLSHCAQIASVVRDIINNFLIPTSAFSVTVMQIPSQPVEIVRAIMESPEKANLLVKRLYNLDTSMQMSDVLSKLANEKYYPRTEAHSVMPYNPDDAIPVYSKEKLAALKCLLPILEMKHQSKAQRKITFIDLMRGANSIQERNRIFCLYRDIVNEHDNPKRDRLFFIKNVNTFQDGFKTVRKDALITLYNQLNIVNPAQVNKIIKEKNVKLCNTALTMPIFNDHINNHWYEGAFGSTTSKDQIKLWRNQIQQNLPLTWLKKKDPTLPAGEAKSQVVSPIRKTSS